MIGLDTNVLIRYAAQDDTVQSPIAESIMSTLTADEPGFISQVALVESIWVLRSLYDVDDDAIATFIERLLNARELVVEDADTARLALVHTHGSREFTDALIAQSGLRAGCTHTVTFDKRASQLDGMKLAAVASI